MVIRLQLHIYRKERERSHFEYAKGVSKTDEERERMDREKNVRDHGLLCAVTAFFDSYLSFDTFLHFFRYSFLCISHTMLHLQERERV